MLDAMKNPLLALITIFLCGCYESYAVRNDKNEVIESGSRSAAGSICGTVAYNYSGTRIIKCQNGDTAYVSYRNGIQNGGSYAINKDGFKYLEMNFKSGQISGSVKFWYSNKNKSLDAFYENGTRIKATFYNKKGLVTGEADWMYTDENIDFSHDL